MLLEHKVRHEVDTVDLSYVGGVAKARQLLKIAKRVRDSAREIGSLTIRFAHRGEWEKANRFRKSYDRLSELHSEIRERARSAMRQPTQLRFDVAQAPRPYPNTQEVHQ